MKVFGGAWRRAEEERAGVVAAREAAQRAFYDLDSAKREVELAVETVSDAEESAAARQVVAEFGDLAARIEQVNGGYLEALDAVEPQQRQRERLDQARNELAAKQAELKNFLGRLQPLLRRAEAQLFQVSPAVEAAKRALLSATGALDVVRAAGLSADGPAARLAELAPELTRLNEGAGRHGVAATLRRAEEVALKAEAVRVSAEQLLADRR